jgi:hypothetical protein
MLLFRAFHGRRHLWEVKEDEYDKLNGAFGRMPIVIHLGDFLQLKPTGTNLSLISGKRDLEETSIDIPAEQQAAMSLFCRTPLCFELKESNRFQDDDLSALMDYIRSPTDGVHPKLEAIWQSIQLKESDNRLQEERFQNGHMIAIYWETVARWINMRAKRDAKALKVPLYLIQSADSSSPRMSVDKAKKLMNRANPRNTGGMHGMLAVHVGMKIRLLEAQDLNNGLVKDAEGEIVQVVPNTMDTAAIIAAAGSDPGTIYLHHLPLGVWVRMKKYRGAPFCAELSKHDASLGSSDTESLVWIEPKTSQSFTWGVYTILRTGFPFTHGRVITSTACQGRTCSEGVIIDCARLINSATCKPEDDWWLDLYVMLSRATRIRDILLIRAPPFSFFRRGPPATLVDQLKHFNARTVKCRKTALQLVTELHFERFLHL